MTATHLAPASEPGAKHGKARDRDQPEQGPEVGPQEAGSSGHVPSTAILLARRHNFLSELNVCRSTDFDRWMRRDIHSRASEDERRNSRQVDFARLSVK